MSNPIEFRDTRTLIQGKENTFIVSVPIWLELIILLNWLIPYFQIISFIVYERLCKHDAVRIVKREKIIRHLCLFIIFSPFIALFLFIKMICEAYGYRKSSERNNWETDDKDCHNGNNKVCDTENSEVHNSATDVHNSATNNSYFSLFL